MASFPDLGLQWGCACSQFLIYWAKRGREPKQDGVIGQGFWGPRGSMSVGRNDSHPQNSQELNTLSRSHMELRESRHNCNSWDK